MARSAKEKTETTANTESVVEQIYTRISDILLERELTDKAIAEAVGKEFADEKVNVKMVRGCRKWINEHAKEWPVEYKSVIKKPLEEITE